MLLHKAAYTVSLDVLAKPHCKATIRVNDIKRSLPCAASEGLVDACRFLVEGMERITFVGKDTVHIARSL